MVSTVVGVSRLVVSTFEFTSQADPGLGARVDTPPTWVLIAGWVVGVIALAILWAASRR